MLYDGIFTLLFNKQVEPYQVEPMKPWLLSMAVKKEDFDMIRKVDFPLEKLPDEMKDPLIISAVEKGALDIVGKIQYGGLLVINNQVFVTIEELLQPQRKYVHIVV